MMKILTKEGLQRRIFGAELVVTGGLLLIAKTLLGSIAPIGLTVYGLYRWLFRKSYPDGIGFIAGGVLLWGATRIFDFLFWIPMLAGVGTIAAGAVLMIAPGGKKDLPNDLEEI